jgi:hypothetical protein
VSVIVADPAAYVAFATWDAVIVDVPILTIVTTLPAIVATLVFEDEYVNATGLFELGSTNENEVSMTFVFVIDVGKLVITAGINEKYNTIPLEFTPSPPYKL